jgi:transitional endoplasmic reticulum ATPase
MPNSIVPPEFALGETFSKARQEAPCYLVFEDLDSLATDRVRSFFLNEVDGLQANDDILMAGSTSHLDRLDHGIAKRPSRFDRKFYFPNPNLQRRAKYCAFWQEKLKKGGNEDVKFLDELCPAVAKIMDGSSFAYIQRPLWRL